MFSPATCAERLHTRMIVHPLCLWTFFTFRTRDSTLTLIQRCTTAPGFLFPLRHWQDIIIASGCSGALEIAIGALAGAGTNILVPSPGFSLYITLASSKEVETRAYKCLVSTIDDE